MDTTQLHAYPHDTGLAPCKGLTKREWYAGLAMMGLIPHVIAINANSYELADRAFLIADAMVYTIQKDELEASK
jgi:hypothetical protein